MSTGGIFSVRPVKTANIVGIVAKCKSTTATQPMVSALILGACSLMFLTHKSRSRKSCTPCLICSVFILILTGKRCGAQF